MIKYIIGFVIVYLAAAFIQADFDFRNWSLFIRFLTIILYSFIAGGCLSYKHIVNDK